MALEIDISRKAFSLADGGERLVFDSFSLRVPEGSVLALLGPSGCGKSSLLRMIAGIDGDFSGALTGRPRRLGMAFQEPRLLPWRNVFDNLRLVAPDLSAEALDRLLENFELRGHGGDFPGQLSLGLARRAALARAFAVAPQLLLLDEPFASLDRALHQRLRDLLVARIHADRTTTIIATHDVDDALLLADEVVLLGFSPARIVARLTIETPRGERGARLRELRQFARKLQAPTSGESDNLVDETTNRNDSREQEND